MRTSVEADLCFRVEDADGLAVLAEAGQVDRSFADARRDVRLAEADAQLGVGRGREAREEEAKDAGQQRAVG